MQATLINHNSNPTSNHLDLDLDNLEMATASSSSSKSTYVNPATLAVLHPTLLIEGGQAVIYVHERNPYKISIEKRFKQHSLHCKKREEEFALRVDSENVIKFLVFYLLLMHCFI